MTALESTQAQSPSLAGYNVIWTSQSRHSGESMPCGGGSTGLNVWVENGDLLLYVSRSGTFDENNALLKLGRIRLKLSPNPFTPASRFRQELHPRKGFVRVTAQHGRQSVEITIWVDVFRPVVHLDLTSQKPLTARISYENWRTQDRLLTKQEGITTSYKTTPDLEVIQRHDDVAFAGNAIRFYHRNRDSTVFDYTVNQQGLATLKDSLWNPLARLTFGAPIRDRMALRGAFTSKRPLRAGN